MKPRIDVCVCTYKRPRMLQRLLSALETQDTHRLFDYSLIIVDNDHAASARTTVESHARGSAVPVMYYVQPTQSISMARNMAVSAVSAEFVAFIDDDEIPASDWLRRMYCALVDYSADGVFGPVDPVFASPPPAWMVSAGLFMRPTYATTGAIIDWRRVGMGNVLVHRDVLDALEGPFRLVFAEGGEDVDFFRRAIAIGRRFIWCGEAHVNETIPPERLRLSFHVRRALLRGRASRHHPANSGVGVLKSLVACVVYTACLPFLIVLGRHVFVKYLIKDLDHLGKLLALCHIDLIGPGYIVK